MHSLIVGVTNSGKTTLAKYIAKKHVDDFLLTKSVDKSVYVYDPMASVGWPNSDFLVCYSDADYFLEHLRSNEIENGLVIIDECKTLYDKDANTLNYLLMQGRHRGLKTILMSQRYVNIPPNSRGNAETIYAFRQNATDTAKIREDFDLIPDLNTFQRFEFVQCSQFNCSKIQKIHA